MHIGREKVYTPLPEVNEQTSRIKIAVGSLALPVGLEPSWIGVDIPVLERAASLAGTHFLVIGGENGEQDEVHVSGSMGEDGSLASSAAEIAKKQRGSLENFSIDGDLNDFITIIKLNNAARRADSGDIANQYDPYIQADLLDKAMRNQLMRASIKSNSNRGENVLDPLMDGAKVMIAAQAAMLDSLTTTSGRVATGVYSTAIVVRGLIRNVKSTRIGIEAQHSLFSSFKADRIALSMAYLATHRLVGVPRHDYAELGDASNRSSEIGT